NRGARSLPSRRETVRQSASLSGRTGEGSVRAEDPPHSGIARSGGVTTVFSIREYDYMADGLVRVGGFERGAIERDVFPDGEHYLRIVSNVLDQHAVVIGGTISD